MTTANWFVKNTFLVFGLLALAKTSNASFEYRGPLDDILSDFSVSATGDVNAPGLFLYNETGSRLLALDSSFEVESVNLYSWVTGTSNRVTIANDGDGTITISGPQDIHTGASPTFADLTLSSPSSIYSLSHDSFADFLTTEHFTEASIDHTNIQNVGTNTHAQIDTHISGDGSDHSDVVLNNTHRTSDGSDHTFIDQDVTATADVDFNSIDVNDSLGVNTTDPNEELDVDGDALAHRWVSETITQTATGPTDDLDVGADEIIFIDTSSNNVTIGGFTNGVAGQKLYITVTDATNNAILEHAEGTGNQDIYLNSGGDETLTASHGGWLLVCNGTHWYEIDN